MKNRAIYTIVLEGSLNGAYTVRAPALKGFQFTAPDLQEAYARSRREIQKHLRHLVKHNLRIPKDPTKYRLFRDLILVDLPALRAHHKTMAS